MSAAGITPDVLRNLRGDIADAIRDGRTNTDWATEATTQRARAERAEAHLALILRVLDDEAQSCEDQAAEWRNNARSCRAAVADGRPAAEDEYHFLTDAERIRLFENCSTRAALEALGLRAVRKIVDTAIAKAKTKEPTT